ncbi:MAG: glycosyltransferase family 4 protein [Ardenticatenaceae bacterium]|mgnify:CR=1 FL=1|nr:glycosyltransferase family 4 protein [Ardenticatenaceae bacterium]
MSVIHVLIVNASHYIVGDTAMLLLSLSCLDPDSFFLHVVSAPRGPVYKRLKQLPNARVYPMEVGGKETDLPSRVPGRRRLRNLASILRISSLVRREGIDLIYTLDRTASMFISYAVSRLTRRPLIMSAHISFYLGHSRSHQLVLNHAQQVTVVSEHMRQQFMPYVNDPEKIIVVPNAITLKRFDPGLDSLTIRSVLGLEPSVPVVVLVGRIDPWKGQAELIQAASIVLEEHPETVFLLIGQGDPEYMEKLKQLVVDLELGEKVLFLGHRDDIPQILAAADIATMPSYYEAFGLVALESMAMAKPVIATKAGGVPEFLVDGEMGILIPPSDADALAEAIIRLLNDPDKANQMGRRGRKHVEQYYSFPQYQRRFRQLFQKSISKGKKESR